MTSYKQSARVLLATFRELPPIAPPVDVDNLPNIRRARDHFASLSPERRAQLMGEWE
jgi:hypothetical protein